MSININFEDFQKSITQELDVVKNRVRNLIGSAHWGEEGRYKEAILRNVIKRFLPSNLSIGTGFILSTNIDNTFVSKQLDIIIYNNTIPVLFSEGDFVIVTESSIKGIIEIKSNINTSVLSQVVDSFNQLTCFPSIGYANSNVFKGVISFEHDLKNIEKEDTTFDEIIKKSNGIINHISFGKYYFMRYWESNRDIYPSVELDGPFYSLYKIENLSYSYFISNLLHMVSNEELDDRYHFSFPIKGTKEIRRKKVIPLYNVPKYEPFPLSNNNK